MFAILERKPEIEDAGRHALGCDAGTIRFENVPFAYEPERPILKGLSFEVPAGHTVALSGLRARASPRFRGCCSASTT